MLVTELNKYQSRDIKDTFLNSYIQGGPKVAGIFRKDI